MQDTSSINAITTRPLSYLDQLAATPKAQGGSARYSCYLLPLDTLYPVGCHLSMLYGAIMRHRYIYQIMPSHAYVNMGFRDRLGKDVLRITGEPVPPERGYIYRFVLGPIDQKVYVNLDKMLPDFLREIRQLGLPSNAIVCIH